MAEYSTHTILKPVHDFRARCEAHLAHQPYYFILDSCKRDDAHGRFDWLMAATLAEPHCITTVDAVAESAHEKWLLGALPYEVKIRVEPTTPANYAPTIAWPEVAFFVADVVCYKKRDEDEVVVCSRTEPAERIAASILNTEPHLRITDQDVTPADFTSNFTEISYIDTVRILQQHIVLGDAYQINLSQQFTAQGVVSDPVELFHALTAASPVGMAAMLRWDTHYVCSISPERFLKHEKGQLITQPIKGTIRHDSASNTAEALLNSPKERAENVMIVDMARNDLQRSCTPDGVKVPHLHEVQSFSTLHHLMSTVTGRLREDISPWQALLHAFPPASMTGTPKVSAMGLIDRYEALGRGGYAGCIGYMAPNGNFDFNVVIRTVQYDAAQHVVLYNVGGAVTYDSDPQAEYDETLLKALALQQVLSQYVHTLPAQPNKPQSR